MRRFIRFQILAPIVAASTIALLVAPAGAQPSTTAFNTTKGVALNGYDVVAYFTDGRPVEGTPSVTHRWQGVTWQFASAANRDAFANTPDR